MKCGLCGNGETGEQSHIIPKFVYDWLKQTGPTPFLRASGNPNKRIQDGIKTPLLCGACEDRFSVWEKAFSENIFRKVHHEGQVNLDVEYESWLLKFAVSVSWRSLIYYKITQGSDQIPYDQAKWIDKALVCWADFLLDRSPHPGHHAQHLMIMGNVKRSVGLDDSPDLNMYLNRAVEFNTIHSPKEAYIFTKMGQIIICGVIVNEDPKVKWKGTQIRVKNGRYFPTEFQVSSCVLTFVNSALRIIPAARKEMSPKQIQKMEESFEKIHGFRPPKKDAR